MKLLPLRHILKLKCTKFDFGWGSAPDPAVGAYIAPTQLDLRRTTSKGKKGRKDGREAQGRRKREG